MQQENQFTTGISHNHACPCLCHLHLSLYELSVDKTTHHTRAEAMVLLVHVIMAASVRFWASCSSRSSSHPLFKTSYTPCCLESGLQIGWRVAAAKHAFQIK